MSIILRYSLLKQPFRSDGNESVNAAQRELKRVKPHSCVITNLLVGVKVNNRGMEKIT